VDHFGGGGSSPSINPSLGTDVRQMHVIKTIETSRPVFQTSSSEQNHRAPFDSSICGGP